MIFSSFSFLKRWNPFLKYTFLALTTIGLANCASFQPISSTDNKGTTNSVRTKIIQYATDYKGKPYKYGGKTPKGFDCSGYTYFVFQEFGYQLGASAAQQSGQGREVSSTQSAQPGDLVFFRDPKKGNGRINHVGIISQNRAGQLWVLHSTSRGVVEDHINNSSYWWPRLAFIKNVVD